MPRTKSAGGETPFIGRTETIVLIKDSERYSEDLTVTHNGKNYLIKRGVPVEVPMFLKLIIEDSYRQQMAASDLTRKLENEFAHKDELANENKRVR